MDLLSFIVGLFCVIFKKYNQYYRWPRPSELTRLSSKNGGIKNGPTPNTAAMPLEEVDLDTDLSIYVVYGERGVERRWRWRCYAVVDGERMPRRPTATEMRAGIERNTERW